MDADRSPARKSARTHSTDTLHTRRSHRSPSRERREKRRDRSPREHRRKRSHSRDRGSERGPRRSRSRERSHRDRNDRDRERDRERRRDRGSDGHRRGSKDVGDDTRDREHRRRKRGSEVDEEVELRSKRPRPDDGDPDSPRRSDRGDRRRDSDRKGDRNGRPPLDPRDEFDMPRFDPAHRDDRRPRDDRPERSPPAPRASPSYAAPPDDPMMADEPREDDSEARSVFVSQLAARLTARDLGYFFEDKLGEGTVMDSRIVTDRISRRSKGIGYVEFRSIDLVDKALGLTGTVVMGLPIMVQLTESERNKLHPGDGNLNLPPGVSAPHGGAMQLYVGSLHFNLTESDIKQVFEPFGELEFVDLHRDPMTGRSKGYAFVQYKKGEDAKMALEQMEGFELAGRQLRVNTVHEKGTAVKYTQHDSLDESGGGNLNAASRQALMQKLARIEPTPAMMEPVSRPTNAPAMTSRSVLLRNMFDPEEESGNDWDRELADDVKGECEGKYGPVLAIKVERDSQGEIYVKFDSIESAKKAVDGLNARWFGGRQISAAFIPDAIMLAHQ